MQIFNLLKFSITLHHYLVLSFLLFTIGMLGIILRRQNIIGILMSLEIMLLGLNIGFVASSAFWLNIVGQIFSIFILAIAAAEIALGLAILVIYFHYREDIAVGNLNSSDLGS